MSELREATEETEANAKYIEDQGYKLLQIWECQWLKLTRTNLAIHQFLESKFHRSLDSYATVSQKQILSAITKNYLFGILIYTHILDHLIPKLNEICPIFKNTEIGRKDIGECMKALAVELEIMSRLRKTIIGSYYSEKILSLPIKWYLEHGLDVTRIYQVAEYIPVPYFKPFSEAVSDARRDGDANLDKAIIADAIKLVTLYNFSCVVN